MATRKASPALATLHRERHIFKGGRTLRKTFSTIRLSGVVFCIFREKLENVEDFLQRFSMEEPVFQGHSSNVGET